MLAGLYPPYLIVFFKCPENLKNPPKKIRDRKARGGVKKLYRIVKQIYVYKKWEG